MYLEFMLTKNVLLDIVYDVTTNDHPVIVGVTFDGGKISGFFACHWRFDFSLLLIYIASFLFLHCRSLKLCTLIRGGSSLPLLKKVGQFL
jgi:hypothetical protein